MKRTLAPVVLAVGAGMVAASLGFSPVLAHATAEESASGSVSPSPSFYSPVQPSEKVSEVSPGRFVEPVDSVDEVLRAFASAGWTEEELVKTSGSVEGVFGPGVQPYNVNYATHVIGISDFMKYGVTFAFTGCSPHKKADVYLDWGIDGYVDGEKRELPCHTLTGDATGGTKGLAYLHYKPDSDAEAQKFLDKLFRVFSYHHTHSRLAIVPDNKVPSTPGSSDESSTKPTGTPSGTPSSDPPATPPIVPSVSPSLTSFHQPSMNPTDDATGGSLHGEEGSDGGKAAAPGGGSTGSGTGTSNHSGGLPRTGTQVGGLIAGVTLLVSGAAAVVISRRRSH